jgi:hypothetical protein
MEEYAKDMMRQIEREEVVEARVQAGGPEELEYPGVFSTGSVT